MADVEIDWESLRAAAIEAMGRAYAPYSNFPVGAAGLVDDGRIVVGCNVENASYGVGLCAECGMVSALVSSGAGRLLAVSCVDGSGAPLMPCGRCRQLLWEHGGPQCLVDHADGPLRMSELLPHAFGPDDLHEPLHPPALAPRLRQFQGQGTVFVHPDIAAGVRVWTAYWERSTGKDSAGAARGILEEGPVWTDVREGVAWGRRRTARVVVVGVDGELAWAGEGQAPVGVTGTWDGPS
jgi:cytidine deaminase